MRLLVAFSLVMLAGCPKKPEGAKRSTSATSCVRDSDCNGGGDGGASCGLLKQCVDQLCSAPTVPIPCP